MSESSLIPILPNHRFDEQNLARYLRGRLAGAESELVIRQYQGGQSNPTFHIQAGAHRYVMRKKPPGKLLPGAHAVEREFAIQQALAGRGVPVPHMHLLCTDDDIIGRSFYIMSEIEGRIFTDRLLGGCTPADRLAMYDSMNAALAQLHNIGYIAAGLQDFGRPENYVARQVSRWARNYQASKLDDLPEMDKVIAWLESHVPAQEIATIVHGDYRIGNLVFHPTQPHVVAVLDWELATIGHPLADLAYNCLPWRLPATSERGFADLDFTGLGIPYEADYIASYAKRFPRIDLNDWEYFLVFAMFRSAAILAGVYGRAVAGNASDARALSTGIIFRNVAKAAWALAETQG
jgi:aminoglycoside phosphotransferase (APT) family kinase protein